MFNMEECVVVSETLMASFSMSVHMQLFHFDVHEDIRTIADATIEKDEVSTAPL